MGQLARRVEEAKANAVPDCMSRLEAEIGLLHAMTSPSH